MLTFNQVQVVAFQADGELLCPEGARDQFGELAIERHELGLHAIEDVHAVTQYELDEYVSSHAGEHADEVADRDEAPDAWDKAFSDYPGAVCDCHLREL